MSRLLLTGASRGIGAAVLEQAVSAGWDVTVIGRTKPDASVEFYPCDFANLRESELVASRIAELPRFDGLVNNAGVGVFGPIESVPLSDWQRVLNVNLLAPVLFIRACLPQMRRADFGRIVDISSDADAQGFAQASPYCASKYALRGVADAVRKELIGTNVSITTVSPGRVDTYFNNKAPGARPLSLSADDVAQQVMHVLQQRPRCHVEEIRLKSTLE